MGLFPLRSRLGFVYLCPSVPALLSYFNYYGFVISLNSRWDRLSLHVSSELSWLVFVPLLRFLYFYVSVPANNATNFLICFIKAPLKIYLTAYIQAFSKVLILLSVTVTIQSSEGVSLVTLIQMFHTVITSSCISTSVSIPPHPPTPKHPGLTLLKQLSGCRL